MVYVPGFQYDVFISYASEDLDDRLRALIEGLGVYLRQELGKEFPERGIFFDKQELNVTPVQWKQKLQDSAGSAALLVPVLSPSWATSEYCAKEWEWFQEERPLNSKAGKETVFRVCPIGWREIDSDLLRQLPPEIPSAQHQPPAQDELGKVIANGLRLLRRREETVYVGHSDHHVRREIRDQFSRMGYRVMPESPMAFGNREIVCELLTKAKVAVHFIGNHARREKDAIQWSRDYCQFATIAYEIPGTEVTATQKLELDQLERNATGEGSYHRISGKNSDQLLELVRDCLKGKPPSEVPSAFRRDEMGTSNPFRGLLPFEKEHAALFFGRDKQIQDIAERLEHRRLLAVTGVSGSGKSSLVMAGVVPKLWKGSIPKLGTRLHVAIMRPRGGPIFRLAEALSDVLGRIVTAEALTRTTYGLVDAVKPLAKDESLLVVVDQFEEIFAYRKQQLSVDGGAAADRFIALLLQATQQTEVPIYVMLTMRSDYLGECAIFRGLPEALNEGHYLVPKMTRLQLQEAIEGPLGAVGAEIRPGLVQRLLNECEEEPDSLPVLQHLLWRMFEEGAVLAEEPMR